MCRTALAVVCWVQACAAMVGATNEQDDEVKLALACEEELRATCPANELVSFVGCSICTMALASRCAAVDMTNVCRETASAPDPQDPPFDLTRVLFSSSFSSQMVLQREPQQSAAFGTATPGAKVTLTLSGPGEFSHEVTTAVVDHISDPAVHGTWKAILPARPPGFGYSMHAVCDGCENATAAVLTDVGFGDVVICSGQSNMEDPVLTTISRNESYELAAGGKYDHIRLYQTGWRLQRKKSTWILPQQPDDQQGYPQQSWQLPRGCPDHRPGEPGQPCSLQRFSAMCWYFGKSLSDEMLAVSSKPVPLGLIHSSIGGTTIQQWMPPWTTGNDTCLNNNCGLREQLDPRTPVQPDTLSKCTNGSQSSVWSCPSGHCSDLWHGMIAPFVNMTIKAAIWYQGEQNVFFGEGSISKTSGYACQQAAMIASWRKAWSAVPGTTDKQFPFGVTSLAGGCSEAFPLWSSFQHYTEAQWRSCATNTNGLNQRTSPMCKDIRDDWAGGLRVAQTGGYGHLPNPALPRVFLGQAFDHGEPCACDRKALPPDGCWANGQCYGWQSQFSLNRTWNYQNSGIHPRVKLTVAKRLARGAFGLLNDRPQPTPKLSGCRYDHSSHTLQLAFDRVVLGEEELALHPPVPGTLLPMQVRVGTGSAVGNSSDWVTVKSLQVLNSTSLSVTLPPMARDDDLASAMPTAIRYAWADSPCCPGLDPSTAFCPPASCTIFTKTSKEPAVPFWAYITETGRCRCDPPWDCSA